MAFMLLWLQQQGRTTGSFLHCAVDSGRAGIAGFSTGGALAPGAALTADELGIPVNALASLLPPCSIWGGSCDVATDSIPQLSVPNYLFMAAEADSLSLPRIVEFSESLAPNSTATEFVLLEGAPHCVMDIDPAGWPVGFGVLVGCGQGTKAPQEAVTEMNQRVGEFFKRNLIDVSPSAVDRGGQDVPECE